MFFSFSRLTAGLLVAGTLSLTSPAFASSVTINSGAATVTYDNTQAGHPTQISTFANPNAGSTFNSGIATVVTAGYLTPFAGTSYISYDANTEASGDNGGLTVYSTTFSGNYLGGNGSITLAADDFVTAFLNGNQIATTNGTQYNSVIGPNAFSGFLLNGTNTLTFNVTNVNASNQLGGPTNLDFKFTANTAATPEPSSLMLLGTGILSVTGVMRRKLSL